MTTQTNLDLVWADAGGVTDPGDAKYTTGWIAEIPTFQNFNFVLQNHSKNQLALAEKGNFEWQAEINYAVGAKVLSGNTVYSCIAANVGQDPATDVTNSYWVKGFLVGQNTGQLTVSQGVSFNELNPVNAGTWDGNFVTAKNKNAMMAFNVDTHNNWILGNVKGELVVADVGVAETPDGRDIDPDTGTSHRIFHEGHPPVQSEVVGTIPGNPVDNSVYGRQDNNWIKVTHIISSEFPPQAEKGEGAGWFNLAEGQLYVDIDDGDTSQWVPASPAASEVVHKNVMRDIAFVMALVHAPKRHLHYSLDKVV